jgi:dipeptidyl aminopeptidase/acylaminoacyl peptidase
VVGTPRLLIRDRGTAAPQGNATSLRWSPTANRLAFISLRDQHSFIGVYDADAKSLVFLDPSTDQDQWPVWSADGKQIAFVRIASLPTTGERGQGGGGSRRVALPWSIRVADAASGKGREVWRASEGMGVAFWLGFMNNERQLFWTADDRIIFPWERTGWMHMYSVALAGGQPTELTPGEFEVEHVALAPNGRELVFSSNQGDIDRRHLWRVSVSAGPPQPVTTGKGIEYWPVFTSDGGALAFQATTAQAPPRVELVRAHEWSAGAVTPSARVPLAPAIAPKDFPGAAFVEPQQVIFQSGDGLSVHGQLYLPPNHNPTERYPALVYLHGGPNSEMVLGYHYHRFDYYQKPYALIQYLASRGYLVMSVNYRRGTGYGMKFREPENPASTNPRDNPDVIDIVAGGQYLRSRADVDPNRIGIWGGSAGGQRTILGLAYAPELFAAGFDLHGVALQTLGKTEAWKAPVLIVHGDDDRNVPFVQSVALAAELRGRGVDVEELVFPNEIHSFLRHESWVRAFEAAADFFDRKLKNRNVQAGTPK